MTKLLSLIAIALLAPSAFADEPKNQLIDVERSFLALCKPGHPSEWQWTDQDRKEAAQFRPAFTAFLKNPAPVVETFKQGPLFKEGVERGFWDNFGEIIRFAATCGLATQFQPKIQAQGCKAASGENISAALAVRLCQPLVNELKRREANEEQPK